jgi:hypothetical protein
MSLPQPYNRPAAAPQWQPFFQFTRLLKRLGANRPLALALVSAASFGVYAVGLVVPYNFARLGLRPLLDIAKLTRGQPVAEAGFVLTFALLSGLYVVLGLSALAFNLLLLWLYPIGAADIFDNIVHARVTVVHGGNPFYDRPTLYSHSDPVVDYAGWRDRPSAYGPLWEVLAASTLKLAGTDLQVDVLAFKLLGIAFYFGCVGLIGLALQRVAPERALQGAILFAYNPLVLYETAGNGHNDIVMTFFILLAFVALIRRWYVLSGVVASVGMLVKFIPALLLPVIVIYTWRSLMGWRSRLAALSTMTILSLGLAAIAYAPFWRDTNVLGLKRKEGLFTTSLPAILEANLEPRLGQQASEDRVTEGALGFMLLVVAVTGWHTWVDSGPAAPIPVRDRWQVPVKMATVVLLSYLLFACQWFQAWYGIWPLVLAALLPAGETGRLAVLLSYAALWKTIVFDFFIDPGTYLPPRIWRETWLAPATLGVAWAYALYCLGQSGWGAVRRWQANHSAGRMLGSH